MLEVLPYLIIPAGALIFFTIKFKASWIFTPAALVGALLFMWMITGLDSMGRTTDYEVWNGQVTSKERDRVSCSHSYSCNCRSVPSYSTDSNGNMQISYHTECDTCYEHFYDIDWDIHSDIGSWSVSREDRQGIIEPVRWTETKIGDAVSRVYSFVNYIKAVDFSIFSRDVENVADKWKTKIPAYPTNIRDYYHIDRVLPVGLTLPNQQAWNDSLQYTLKDIGPKKQVNAVVVIVNSADTSFADALNTAWLGGKKNDAILIIGTTKYPDIAWVRVLSWTDNALFKVELRNKILDLKTMSPDTVVWTMRSEILKHFKRRDMEDFKYLEKEQELSTFTTVFLWLLSLLAIPGAYFLLQNFRDTKDEFLN